MKHKLDIENLDNPYVQVVWEDTPENFTQEKIKSVKQYFQKKYMSNNVNVITKVKSVEETDVQSVDISFNILDQNYQRELIKSYLKSKSAEDQYENILKIDSQVENKLVLNETEVTPFKKWFIKRIEFSNFLSYGDNQVLDFDKCNGITVVESDPPNFGGKTVLTVDLLLFLFFNTTTKTQKAEEIFNRFTDKNKVSVRGDILIDGEEYILVRTIERKLSKAGEWNVKTNLDFFKKLSDGSLQNFTGEQRRETENFIKKSIGEMDDFLMTILTTASNLEDLLESKPTARGQVLSRFLGLEFLKKKEEAGKDLYSEFSKSMLSNIYNTESLKQEIEDSDNKIVENETTIKTNENLLTDVKQRILKGQEYRDGLISQKHMDIDNSIAILSPEKLNSDIESLKLDNTRLKTLINTINVVEPSSYYKEDEHDKVKEDYNTELKKKFEAESKISNLNELAKSVSGGVKCEHCGIELLNAEITKTKLLELAGLTTQKDQIVNLMNDLSLKEKSFTQLKKEFDEYEKNKLIKEKHEVTIESNDLKITSIEEKLEKYNQIQVKIEENKQIETKLIKANLRMDELNGEQIKYDREINQLKFQNETLNKKIKENYSTIQKISEESEREKIYKLYLEIFGKNGITKSIMKTMMPIINSELQRLLQDSSYFKLEIRINDKNEVEFVMIDNNTQVEKLMTSGSGYEKTIASLALRSVLSKICSLPKPNIIVMDEVFGKISNENLDMVYEFFVKIKDYFEKIFLITHNPLISNWGDNVVKIKKEENISEVKQ
jgi:DNA repair exonuclease SbcCD ATPase subunit